MKNTNSLNDLENILKCNEHLLKYFMSNNLKTFKEEILEIVNHPIFQDKMKNLLKYYKPRGNEDMNVLQQKKILGRFTLTKVLSEMIYSASDNLVN